MEGDTSAKHLHTDCFLTTTIRFGDPWRLVACWPRASVKGEMCRLGTQLPQFVHQLAPAGHPTPSGRDKPLATPCHRAGAENPHGTLSTKRGLPRLDSTPGLTGLNNDNSLAQADDNVISSHGSTSAPPLARRKLGDDPEGSQGARKEHDTQGTLDTTRRIQGRRAP
nr:hypothetical protein GCM10020241_19760 [Streptoalloteichus tenebrarius]